MAQARKAGSAAYGWTWIHSDHLGSSTLIADNTGNAVRRLAYKAFGEEVINAGTGEQPPYTYTGKELDSSGLMYYGARYYDPALARFITPDTVADRGTQGLNRYSYALNNPVRYNDPSGHGVVDSFLYGGWGQHVAESIQAGAASVTSFSSSLIGADSGAGMIFSVTAYNSGVDLAAGLLSGFFSLGTGTGDWIADPLDYNKIPVLGPVGQNFGTSVGEAFMEPSVETGARAVAASCQVVGTAFGTAQLARMVGIPGTKGHPSTIKILKSSNEEIRQWYNNQTKRIPELNQRWIKQGLSSSERAYKAWKIRHDARLKARQMMKDPEEVALLRLRDLEKYTHPDGPTFEYEYNKYKAQGLTEDDIYNSIIEGSTRTNKEYNQRYHVK